MRHAGLRPLLHAVESYDTKRLAGIKRHHTDRRAKAVVSRVHGRILLRLLV